MVSQDKAKGERMKVKMGHLTGQVQNGQIRLKR